ncbi:MAG: hypothetical protein ABIS92_03900, partial [Polyangia bacterium]
MASVDGGGGGARSSGGSGVGVDGSGGDAVTGSGGSVVGSGGAPEDGTGGAPATGTGGSSGTGGSGGRNGTGGSGGRSGTGGSAPNGTGGSGPNGTGGSGPNGTGGMLAGSGGAAGAGTPTGVAMFVAGGYRGRTTISCDDGASWVANHSDDDSVCPNHDCGEVFNTITGVTYGDGHFFITRGWGKPGNVLRSEDGVTWTQVYSGTQFGGVAFGNHSLVVASGWQSAWYSTNAGQTLTKAQDFSGLLGSSTGTIRNV